MMHLLVLVSKRGPLPPPTLASMPALAARTLPFRALPYRPDAILSPSGCLALFAWDNDTTTARPLIHAAGTTATALAGCVVDSAVADPFDVGEVATSLALSDRLIPRLGGSFALVRADADRDRAVVWNTVTRLV